VIPPLGDALAWLDRHVNLEAIVSGRAPGAERPTLERIRRWTSAMGEPQADYPVVHVTGTNGKGSTVRMATALLVANGLTVGTYSSPHLERVNERIARDGDPIDDESLTAVLSALRDLEPFVLSLPDEPGGDRGVPPTWFELVTAGAYRWFSDMAVEAAVVEVGLGGRHDATNVADGVVAAVTNVSLDHTDLLGPTRGHIAAEKAGIIKPGSVVVLGETDPSLVPVFTSEADRVGAEAVWLRDRDFGCVSNRLAHAGRVVDLRTPGGSYDDIFLPLVGAHQGDNAAVALASAEAFFGGPLSEDTVSAAMASVTVPGRMEVVGRRPLVVLDGAHNVDGARVAGETLDEDFAGARRIILVMGLLRGREPGELLRGVAVERTAHVVGCPAPSARGQEAGAVVAAAKSLGIEASEAGSVGDALDVALSFAGENDLVLVTGSLYVVGAARTLLRGRLAA
jgi:dihydrofolate synthase/folylpolyglutamate synthase